ncbi:MAG: flagellar hook-length control protein FliK [Acidimicrobiales bacterium]
MIEIDGLMAAVLPSAQSASTPSAAAPAEFAAAMALAAGETAPDGTAPRGQQAVAEAGTAEAGPLDTAAAEAAVTVIDADPSLSLESLSGAESLLDADAVSDAESLLDTDPRSETASLFDAAAFDAAAPEVVGEEVAVPEVVVDEVAVPDAESPDGTELALASTAAIAATVAVDPTRSDPALSSAQDPGSVEISTGAVPASATAPLGEIDPSAVPAIDESTGVVDASILATSAVPTDANAVASDPAPVTDAADAPSLSSTVADPSVVSTVAVANEAVESDDAIGDASTIAESVPAGPAVVLSPSSSADTTEAVAVEPAVDAVESPSGSVAADAVVDAGAPAASADALHASDSPQPTVQPAAMNTPAPRSDAAVTDVADVLPAPSVPVPDASPTQQVAEALREVRRLADGSHRLSLQLHPEELGAVQLEVAIRDGRLHVRAVAETEAARSALEKNLPELRSDLRDAGVRAGSLEVGPDASGRDRSDSPTREFRPQVRREQLVDARHASIPEPTVSSGLDIRL